MLLTYVCPQSLSSLSEIVMGHADYLFNATEESEESLCPRLHLDRRGAFQRALSTGFAAAVQVQAQTTVNTDTHGLTAGEVRIPVGDGLMPAYRAMPAGGSGLPTVLVVQEIFGVHEYIQDVVRRLAKLGYLAVAPELYGRQGDPAGISDHQTLLREIVSKVPDAQVMADLDAAASWAAANGGGGKLGITGFCWGGRIVWMYAAHHTALAAGVAWYGATTRAYHPGDKTALDVAAQIKAPVLGLYGGDDAGIPVETVEKLSDALKATGNRRCEIVIYPDAPHAFHADYRPSYRKQAAEDGWRRMSEWFEQHLK